MTPKQRALRPYERNPMGHVWKTDDAGGVDIFGFDGGTHNGPICVKCGYGFCHHCRELPDHPCTSWWDAWKLKQTEKGRKPL